LVIYIIFRGGLQVCLQTFSFRKVRPRLARREEPVRYDNDEMRFIPAGRWPAVILEKFSLSRWNTRNAVCCLACALALMAINGCGRAAQNHAMLPDGYLDTPANGASISKITPVMGWALSEDGIEGVSIYLDRRYMMDAKTGLSRPDVGQLHPQIPGADKSGWEADLKLDGIPPGVHTITAIIRSKAGATACLSTRATVQ
jgi:hypothetical protein